MPKVVHNSSKGLFQSAGADFNLEGTTAGYGKHIMVEAIDLTYNDSLVGGRASRYIPAGAILTKVALINSVLGGGTAENATFNVMVNTADVAVGGSPAGTEVIGAGASATTIPNGADHDNGSADVLGNSQVNDTAIDRAANASYFLINNAGDNSSATQGSAQVTLVVEWYGAASVAV